MFSESGDRRGYISPFFLLWKFDQGDQEVFIEKTLRIRGRRCTYSEIQTLQNRPKCKARQSSKEIILYQILVF